MADETIGNQTASTDYDLLLAETRTGETRKAKRGVGTSFPSSPVSGDVFYRRDRNLEYFYDGTRWLTTQLFAIHCGTSFATSSTQFLTDTGYYRAHFPHGVTYNAYVEALQVSTYNTASTASNYATISIAGLTGSISTQNNTASAFVNQSLTMNQTITNGQVQVNVTETGAMNIIVLATVRYRLIG